jgi:methylenetetrahydrofolate reductase (NADPH)
MKVIEHIENTVNPKFSYEILPPQKGEGITKIIDIVSQLRAYDPAWINVTSHASSLIKEKTNNGEEVKRIYKKRPGTISVCGVIQNKFGIDAVAHMLCQGFTREETENALIDLNYLGVENILALRGDNLNYDKELGQAKRVNSYANELAAQVYGVKNGKFLDNTEYYPLDFCVGVAGYPEKHAVSLDIDTDIMYLKQKVDAGAEYIITQMFFDNNKYYDFVARCRKADINVPIIPGLKLLKTVKQLQALPELFHVSMPKALVEEATASPEHIMTIGQNWLKYQIHDLLEHGVKNLHFFLMNDAKNILDIVAKI